MRQLLSRKERHLDLHCRRMSRRDEEGESARHPGAVQQRVNNGRLGARLRTVDPEGAEERKLLTLGRARVDGEPSGGDSIYLAFSKLSEIAAALKDFRLVQVARRIDRIAQPNAGEERDVVHRRHVEMRTKVEKLRRIDDAFRDPVFDDMDFDRRVVDEPCLQQLKREAPLFAKPERLVLSEVDIALLIVAERAKRFWNLRRRLVVALGEIPRA